MASSDKIINELIETIDTSIADFNKALPGIQNEILDSILGFTKQLTLPAKSIKDQVENLKILGKIKSKIHELVLTPEYSESIKAFVKSFDTISTLQNKYFNSIADEFTPNKLLKEIKLSYVDYTIDSLTEAGIDVVSSKIEELLLRNITSGGSYASMVKEVSGYLTGENGALVKYSRQITTDALNQYSASYTKAVTDDLGLKWFRYVGSNIKTTRPFCLAATQKDFFHISELPEMSRGVIDGRQVSTAGMIPGTNAKNIQVLRGGWNCQHQLYPVSEFAVPKEIRIAAYNKLGIKYDDDGFAIAA